MKRHAGSVRLGITIVALLGAVVGLQAVRERSEALGLPANVTGNLLYLRSPAVVQRAALSFDALAADVYWLRVIQHFGSTKLSKDPNKQYDLLYPLLDLTTSLDPRFDVAYRFGAIFLAEPFPGGAGRPDQAIALLEKGLAVQPTHWEFAHDIGFVHYWWLRDYDSAAEWFLRASRMPKAPAWLPGMAAVTAAEGGRADTSRRLWQEMVQSDTPWLRENARYRLRQLDAIDQIAALERLVRAYASRAGALPSSWADLQRTGYLRGTPVDPEGHAYVLNPWWGTVTLSPQSPLNPLPINPAKALSIP